MPSKSHAYFFLSVICSTHFWLYFKLTKSSQKSCSQGTFLCWKEGCWTWVSSCLFTGFHTLQLENLHWPFLVLNRPLCTVEEALLLWGPHCPLFSGTFPKVNLEASVPLPYQHQGFQRVPVLLSGDTITLLLQWELARYAFLHSPCSHF